MIWKTKILEMMNTKYPIIMGAFVGLGKAEFAAAFSNAGGFGILAAINFKNIEDFQSEIDKMKRLTNKPWGVNFSIMPPYLIEKMGGKGRSEESYLDFVDLALFASHWLQSECGLCGGADLTGDHQVRADDLREFLANWLMGGTQVKINR